MLNLLKFICFASAGNFYLPLLVGISKQESNAMFCLHHSLNLVKSVL